MIIDWEFCHFTELDVLKLHKIYAARQAVFIIEQNCVCPDAADDYDPVSHHLTGWRRDKTGDREVAAYLRIIPPGKKFAEPSLGRVLTAKSVRGAGLGRELMRRGIDKARETYPDCAIRISAQHYLEKFYRDLGFVPVSGIYDEDGIPHVAMVLAG